MNRKIINFSILIIFIATSLSFSTLNTPIGSATQNSVNIYSKESYISILRPAFTSNAPTVDGYVSPGEWLDYYNGLNILNFTDGKVYVMSDHIRLYLLFDLLNDTVNNPNDYIQVSFDVNNNRQIDNNTDINYAIIPGTTSLRYQYYTGPAEWTPLYPDTYSSVAKSFSCNQMDGSLIIRDYPFANTCNSHRIWELAIDFNEIHTQEGYIVKMGFQYTIGTTNIGKDFPDNFDLDFSNYIQVDLPYLGKPRYSVNPAVSLGFYRPNNDQGIEVTQAVQDRQNGISLVDGKATVVRVFPEATLSTSTAVSLFSQTIIVYLYGQSINAAGGGTTDLPGSPLAMLFHTPVPINRSELTSSANFNLPDSWTHGTNIYYAKIIDPNNHSAEHPSISINYRLKTSDFTVWIVKINNGTDNNPNVVTDDDVAMQESAMISSFPLRRINFVIKPWQVLGACTGCKVSNDLNSKLNAYHFGVIMDWQFNGKNFKLPDLIYGMLPRNAGSDWGGLADPIWNGGYGYVANGEIGGSVYFTMAHELNHVLDRSQSGTWGRHVSNPNNNNDPNFGCGAQGPDPNWVYPPNDDYITRSINGYDAGILGFDTRYTVVVPGSTPDFMSYCTINRYPLVWISGYRWSNLLSTLPNPSTTALVQNSFSQLSGVPNYLHVTGHVNSNSTGNFDSLYVMPGVSDYLTPDAPVGSLTNASLIIYNAAGGIVVQKNFNIYFRDLDGNKINSSLFDFYLPTDPSYSFVNLKVGGTTLATYNFGSSLPTVTVTNPKSNDVWTKGIEYVNWTSSNADSFVVLYSPDNGVNWHAVSSMLYNVNSFAIDASILPPSNGPNALFEVWAFNANNFTFSNSSKFEVDSTKSVNVNILNPFNNVKVQYNTSIELQGLANEAFGSELPDNQTFWEINGAKIGLGKQLNVNLIPGDYNVTFVGFYNNQISHASIDIIVTGTVPTPTYNSTSTTSSSTRTTSISSSGSNPLFGFPSFEFLGSLIVLTIILRRSRKQI